MKGKRLFYVIFNWWMNPCENLRTLVHIASQQRIFDKSGCFFDKLSGGYFCGFFSVVVHSKQLL